MFCWKCGQEVKDNARFCPNCGTELRRADVGNPEVDDAARPMPFRTEEPVPAATTYTSSPEVRSAPKKKNRSWIVVVAIIAGLMVYGLASKSADKSSGTADSSSPKSADLEELTASLEDIISLHKVYVSDEGDGLRIFEIVFYGADTHTLTGITEEYVFDKSYGYSMESVRAAGFESDFPAFAESSYAEDDDYVAFICKMKDLKNVSHLQALVDIGFMTVEEGSRVHNPVSADGYMDSVLALGWEEASMLDYSLLDFN